MSEWLLPVVIGIPLLVEGRYIYSILKGETKPSFVAFLIFTLEMTIVLFASYTLGAHDSLVLIGTFTVLHFITALLALKYGYVSFSKFNVLCLILSIFGLVVWFLTDNAWYALLIEIFVDIIGYLVLSRKLYICPDTEDSYAWGLSVLAYGLNLMLISTWIPEEYLFSLVNVFMCTIIFVLSLRKQKSL